MSKIEWTEKTWNPIVGCLIASSGCAGCYAVGECWRKMAHPNERVAKKFEGTVRKTAAGQLVWTGRINFDERALREPLRRKKSTTYFVNSLSDLFFEELAIEIIDRIFAVICLTPNHRYQILTKRAHIMDEYFAGNWRERVSAVINAWPEDEIGSGNEFLADIRLLRGGPIANLALGVSVENQQQEWRIEHLTKDHIPAAVRFLSCEPLVAPLSIARHLSKLDWVIVGGESGPKARVMRPEWVRKLRDECAELAHVAFFFKQWGDWFPVGHLYSDEGDTDETIAAENVLIYSRRGRDDYVDPRKVQLLDATGFNWANEEAQPPAHVFVFERRGKKKAGRVLDGEVHNDMPRIFAA